jgi:hypothetical protein
LEGGPPIFRQDFTCPALLVDPEASLARTGLSPVSRPPFQTVPVRCSKAAGLVRFRSPLLAESRLMSFPPANEMFQFAGFASTTYGLGGRSRISGGLPHSEIRGSMGARPSPRLIAACYVLHRLSVPRHPPNALTSRLIRRNRRTQEQSPASAGLATQLSSRSGHGIEASG